MTPFQPTNLIDGEYKFICSRPFQTEAGQHWPGDEIDAKKIPDIQLLVQTGLVIPYAPDKGYEYLPSHLWPYVNTKQEAEAKIAGDPSARRVTEVPKEQKDNPVIKEANEQAEVQSDLHNLVVNQRRRSSTPKPQIKKTGSVESGTDKKVASAAKKAEQQTALKVAQGEQPITKEESKK